MRLPIAPALHDRVASATPYPLINNLLIEIKHRTSHALQGLRMRELPGRMQRHGLYTRELRLQEC